MKQGPKEAALEYAGFWIRLGAGVIDLLLLGLVVGAIVCVYPVIVVWAPSGLIISFIYWLGFWSWRGQTPGKMVVGIKIIRTDGSQVTWQHALIRCFGYIVLAISLFIGFIWVAFDARKQGFHDKVADTYVVKLPVKQAVLAGSYARGGASCV